MKPRDPFNALRQLELPVGDYAVFGSGPLMLRSIIELTNDVDVICRGEAWERVCALGEPEYLEEYDVTVVAMENGTLTFGNRWAIGDPNIDDLIDTAEIVDGLPCVRLEHVFAYKELAGRDKDRSHLDAARQAGLLKS